jgi:hypothetical protein
MTRAIRGCLTIQPVTPADLRQLLSRFPSLPFLPAPTIVEAMPRLLMRLGGGSRLLIKRDDAIPFGFGGNKVRKLSLVAARAVADGADTLITAGGVQSNHARATAAAAAKLGLRAVLVANGEPPDRLTANALLDKLLGAEVVYVPTREDRAPRMLEIAHRLGAEGRRAFVIPIGASTSLGALGFALAVAELVEQIPAPKSLSTRLRRAERRPVSSPAAGCSGCTRASSASAPTIPRRRSPRRSARLSAASLSCSTSIRNDCRAAHRSRSTIASSARATAFRPTRHGKRSS